MVQGSGGPCRGLRRGVAGSLQELKRVYSGQENVQGIENPIRSHIWRLRGAITWVINATTIVS